ncbi:MAG: crossover junction endodeoxyribonuclease RuvC [bacterium]|nr:crossover junction endodeoxyribonuclease RuvC [bacterium]
MRIIGIDPGTLATGYGIVEAAGQRLLFVAAGCVRNRGGVSIPARLLAIHRGLGEVFAEYRPDEAAVEDLFFCRNAASAFRLGEARGVALLAAAEHGVPVAGYAPSRVKQAVLGRGGARKEQVRYMVQSILGMAEGPEPSDAADALAVAICHALARRRPTIGAEGR